MTQNPVVLCILDGFGYREALEDNAVKLARTPHYDRLWAQGAKAWLKTSGLAVGLPDGQMGNSEVGHMSLGTGRIIMQDLPKISAAAQDGSLKTNPALQKLIETTKEKTPKGQKGRVHLLGLLSPGGVHSHMDHMTSLAQIISAAGLELLVHAFLDGRDTPPRSSADYMARFEASLPKGARIASLSGRYYAMDRDNRWDRVEKAWHAIVMGCQSTGRAKEGLKGAPAANKPALPSDQAALKLFPRHALEAIEASYRSDKSDEFILPTPLADYDGMQDGDGLLIANFRADRAREIAHSLIDPEFTGFIRPRQPKFAMACAMTDYSERLKTWFTSLFPSETISESLGEIVARAGLKQLRLAETEKYAHVTFFFSGGREEAFEGESRLLIPSPNVATYDLKPEMSAPEVTDALTKALAEGQYALLVVNYANPDMVGHTGDLQAAIKAVEAVDDALGRLAQAVEAAGAVLLVTADHGNVELMRDLQTGEPHTAHTDLDVPLILYAPSYQDALSAKPSPIRKKTPILLQDGALKDIAPTILALMGLKQPAVMTGHNLILAKKQALSALPATALHNPPMPPKFRP